jgi:putative NIF3 family GTP cyclohydrolase 1 type 2
VDDSVEYHKKNLTKSVELLSLLKGHRPVDFETTQSDWNDFWEENYYPEEHKQYTEEEMNAMCERAATENDKDKCREYNLREAEYYTKRAELDAHEQQAQEIAKQVKADGYSTSEKKYKTYDEMIAEGWQMTDDGFWIKETDKGTLSISS